MRSIALGLFLTICSIVSGTTYYVSPTGRDTNAGTLSSPWATWEKAFNSPEVQPGDIVYFRGGIYYNTVGARGIRIERDGTITDTLKYWAYPGEKPILDCSNVTSAINDLNYGIYAGSVNYVHFKGLTVRNVWSFDDNDEPRAWDMSSANTIVDNCVTYNTHGVGFRIASGTSNSYYLNCDSFNHCDSLKASAPGNDGYGFWVHNTSNLTGSVTFEGCRAWNCGDDGFSMFSVGSIVLNHCWSFKNGQMEGLGSGFKLGFSPASTVNRIIRRTLTNCISAYNRYAGFNTNDNGDEPVNYMNLYNNIAYRNYNFENSPYVGSSRGFLIFNTADTEAEELKRVFRNNISYGNDVNSGDLNINVSAGASYTHSNNSWDGAVIVNDLDFLSLDSTGISGPRQADGSLPNLNFLKLASTSDLIDAGIAVGLPFSGAAPDLGYSEYTSGNPAPAIPVYASSVIENATPSTLTLTYNLTLANIVPAASSFAVRVNSTARTVSSVAISGTRVILTLASPVTSGQTVTVAYTKPATNPLQTSAGGQAAAFTAQNVTNNVATPVNQPPVISISSPTKSTAFIAPATITIDAVAYDPDGIVSKVEFYNGSVKLGEIITAPYTYTWKDVTEGSYTITAVATDDKGAKKTSEPVNVVVEKSTSVINQVPVVNLRGPGSTKKPKKNDEITLVADAYDPDGTITKVEFKSGEVLLAEVDTAPYKYVWEASDTGTFVITAIAFDNVGAHSVPAEIEFIVDADFQSNSEHIKLYPNPNKGNFSIDLELSLPKEKSTYSIFSVNGDRIYEEEVTGQEYTKHFNLSEIKSGTYILMITSGKTIIATKKFVKN